MITINGIGVSPGISIGNAHVGWRRQDSIPAARILPGASPDQEAAKFKAAVTRSVATLQSVIITGDVPGGDGNDILEVHLELLSDPQLESDVLEKIYTDRQSAYQAVTDVIEGLVHRFSGMDDDYLKERVADIEDIGSRLQKELLDTPDEKKMAFRPNSILVTDALSPSDTVSLDVQTVIGFATREGGKTSHTAIVARSRGIPAIVGCGEELNLIRNDDSLILDGDAGCLFVNPSPEVAKRYAFLQQAQRKEAGQRQSLKDVPAMTTDGLRISILANISGEEDMDAVLAHGGEGIGLLRTELLFMDRTSFPTEEDQFNFYKAIAIRADGRPVTIRTLDIGGDKPLSYFPLPPEQNPFMGYRGIRISLDKTGLFCTQLKAILRASAFGHLKILLPLISDVREVRAAMTLLSDVKTELTHRKIPYDKNIETGIMIETPAAALTADLLAKEVDFFSIGTNDLCQYTLAVDRMNATITALYDPFHPAVLRLIRSVIEQGHAAGIRVAMCGELAADPLATLLLLGLGLDEFSVNAPVIPVLKKRITRTTGAKATSIAKKVMKMGQSADIISYLQEVQL